jgi:hydroxymethylglutaryl-CoA reductase (NADPH)
VASASRGAKAITRAGGVLTWTMRQRMIRAPLYEFDSVATALRFVRWVGAHAPEIRAQVGTVSRHAHLEAIEPVQIGRVVHLRFVYETGDAAGQNMTTACTWAACQWINSAIALVPGLEPECALIEGNTSGDKKLDYMSLISTRGIRVAAECQLDRATLLDVLKVTPEQMTSAYEASAQAAIQSGMVGHSINVANAVAAIFTATGQDIACVHESGSGILSLRLRDGGLHAEMLLPALVLGTVGGGTRLPNQSDCLELLGCAGPDRVPRLAEIVAGFALALDLSTLAAVLGGQFADAHERLGRNRSVNYFKPDDLTPKFFTLLLAHALDRPDLVVEAAEPLELDTNSSIVSQLSAQTVSEKLVGITSRRLTLHEGDPVDVVIKAKPLDAEVLLATSRVASLCGPRIAETYRRWRDWTGFKGTHLRELAVYELPDPAIARIRPRTYGTYVDPRREAYLIVMERLEDGIVAMDAAEDPHAWRREYVLAALEQVAGAHAAYLGRERELSATNWIGPIVDARRMAAMSELWSAFVEHNANEYPAWIDATMRERLEHYIAEIPSWWKELETMPRTLIHNDFNPRNLALRRDGLQLIAYDWELATVHVPQRDLAELLAFVLDPTADAATVERYVEAHRRALEQAAGASIDRDAWRRGYELALRDLMLNRLGLYMLGHTQRSYPFLERVVPTTKRLLEIEERG